MGVTMNRKRWIRRAAVIGPGCWPWKGWLTKLGYAAPGGRPAHRESYLRFVGDIAPGLVIMHKCDNRACIRPSHLMAGTQRDNLIDMDKKGRRVPPSGSRNANALLSESDVTDIRTLSAFGASNVSLADAFGISVASIRRIKRRASWAHVP